MLSAAQKQVGVSAPTEPDDSPQPGAGGTGKLSQAQIEAMLALNSDTFGSDSNDEQGEDSGDGGAVEGSSGEGSDEPPPPPDEDAEIAEKFRAQIDAERQDNAEAEAEAEPAQSAEEGGKKKKAKKEKAPKEKKPVDPVAVWRILTVACTVIALALGFCVCLLMFTDVIKSGNEQFAVRAANAVNSKLPINTDFYVYRAYVNNGQLADECILYGVTGQSGVNRMDMYRVVIEKNAPSIVNIYYTLDENSPDYQLMKQSEDSKIRIQASQLKLHSDEIYDADREIQIGSPKWEKINCALINNNITSEQTK